MLLHRRVFSRGAPFRGIARCRTGVSQILFIKRSWSRIVQNFKFTWGVRYGPHVARFSFEALDSPSLCWMSQVHIVTKKGDSHGFDQIEVSAINQSFGQE
jgi:hypothetical protein